MKKRKISAIAMGFVVLIVLVVALLLRNTLRRSSHITLPDTAAVSAQQSGSPGDSSQALVRVEVTPKTVRSAVATLKRPGSYIRSLTVERIWSGGSGTVTVQTIVAGVWTRTDTALADGRTRHAITDGKTTYIWYDSETDYYTGAAAAVSADNEQQIPTYEDILALEEKQIAAADYRTFSGEDCIYVETAQDADGYALRYWVSVRSGLLLGAEKLLQESAVYRMTAQPLQEDTPSTADFTLPDGTVLLQIG